MTRRTPPGCRTTTGILLAGLLAVTCSREASPPVEAPQPPEVRVARASVQTLVRTDELPGSVEPVRLARISSPAEGPVEGLAVREGDPVHAGQVLLGIGRTRGAQGRLAASREELRNAVEELSRVERLVAKGALPAEALDRARVEMERARANVTVGEESVSDFQVRAPWDGVVSKVFVEDGQYVAPRALLVEVFDPSNLVVRVALPEAAAAVVPSGTPAKVRFDAFPGREFAATVSRLYPELDRRLRTRTAELTVSETPPLAPGMFARVILPVETARDAITVPRSALVFGADGRPSLFVVAEGQATRRIVAVGVETPERVEIRSGVQAGEEVVVAGAPRVKDGAAVRVAPPADAGAPP